ncbi:DUF3592 domain-containing protein [Sinomicrobium weinanense]|uniref:DUF3592 domain-containing protein n=1 Tax=Sinomicrobium weinanense TaxID=2842200 RepID=A0A926Q1R6_9FLAO|nr:DUF3592 domain-containing protein [Sinomicrobium weinanense]MBC9795848.1 hypothetical protein [Sinomicrobium weinanense]MBU3125368.1 DUF3592 domain-containing protein [Sinomicrobium weinanense]
MKDKLGHIALTIIALTVILGVFYQYYQQKNIIKYKQETIGTVVEFQNHSAGRSGILYEYVVNGKKYTGQVGINKFKCGNGKWGCVGEKFKVYYSSKNPKYSKIDLGKYEKYKATVEFVK